jgi:phosphoserine phosphatase
MELGALRPVLFFTWNSRSYAERWARRAGMAGMALVRPFMYGASRTFATQFLHTLLRGVSRDRLDLLGEEYFQYILKPQMRREAVETLVEAIRAGERVVLVSQLLDHILKPLAKYFGVECIIANRLEFRDRIATGRLLDPVVRPRGPQAWISSGSTDGRIARGQMV